MIKGELIDQAKSVTFSRTPGISDFNRQAFTFFRSSGNQLPQLDVGLLLTSKTLQSIQSLFASTSQKAISVLSIYETSKSSKNMVSHYDLAPIQFSSFL